MFKIIIMGGGGHTLSCIDVIQSQSKFSFAGVVLKDKNDTTTYNFNILGYENDLKKLRKKYKYALIGIARVRGSKTRYRLYNSLKKNKFILPIIKSKFSYVSPKAQISEGTIIMHGAIINSNVEIGKNCIINTGSIIDHGATIGNHTHITTGVVINGDAEVGEQNYIGSGSVVHQGIKINDQRIISSFSRISKNI